MAREVQELKSSLAPALEAPAPSPAPGPPLAPAGEPPAPDVSPGVPVPGLPGASEISIAASANGRNVVVATNALQLGGVSYVVSTDAGQSFGLVQTPTFPMGYFQVNGDPSLAVGQSGRFYLAQIGFPTFLPGTLNPATAATAISTAMPTPTLSGTVINLTYRNDVLNCPHFRFQPGLPGACLPDQEHIAADRVNAGPGGGTNDQVYSVWRHFTPNPALPGQNQVAPRIACSLDSGLTSPWPIARTVGMMAGVDDFPRVTVGQDGTVYVVYLAGNQVRLGRFSSCAAGLNPQSDAMVATLSPVRCPVPGLDRCFNAGLTLASPTVTVDEDNPGHIFVAYATNTCDPAQNPMCGPLNEDVVVRDSLDFGASWTRPVTLNAPVAGRRFMPWICALNKTANVTWYDRRNATAANNDVTDFFRNRVTTDAGGNLVAGTEVRLTPFPDAHCASGWATGPPDPRDAESCAQQPQLAGSCVVNTVTPCDFSDCDVCVAGRCQLSGTPCSFDANCQTMCPCTPPPCPVGPCPPCQIGLGQPKYGDYNEAACAAGRVYAAWAAATDLLGNPNPVVNPGAPNPVRRIDTFVDATLVCCVPRIQVPSTLAFPETRVNAISVEDLSICNTGLDFPLNVTSIASSDAQFFISRQGFSVTPGECTIEQVRFQPTADGPQSGTLTLTSTDPVSPTVQVAVSGLGRGPRPVRPLLECIDDGPGAQFTARFGYDNQDDIEVFIGLGSGQNAFSPEPEFRGQPVSLLPGLQIDVFRVVFDGGSLAWTLQGPDGVTRTAAASSASDRCPLPPLPPPPRALFRAFAFGADSFTREVPDAPGRSYVKVVQNGANFDYSPSQGHGYTDRARIDGSPNNRGVFSGSDEIYDQFVGVRGGTGLRIVFRVDVPNGRYRFVAAGGDAAASSEHSTTIRVRDGSDGAVRTLVADQRLRSRQFYRVGFGGLEPPAGDGSGTQPEFTALATSPALRVTKGYLEVIQEVGAGQPNGGDLCLIEIWRLSPPPDRLRKAFAFGADGFTREVPDAPGRAYVKVVQNGANFDYAADAGHGYTDRADIDSSPNNRGVLSGLDEIYDQFIGVRGGGGLRIVFRVDLPNGLYRFVAAGGDAASGDHSTTIRVRNGSTGAVQTLVQDLVLPARRFYRVGFDGLAPPGGDGSGTQPRFEPLVASPALSVTQGFLEIIQEVGQGQPNGGDLCLFEVWDAGP